MSVPSIVSGYKISGNGGNGYSSSTQCLTQTRIRIHLFFTLLNMPSAIPMLYLPDTMSAWPWQRAINPYFNEVKAASNSWFKSFRAFSPASQKAFDKCDFCLLAALAYPRARKEHLRAGCDLMNLFFVIDEYTDVEDANVCRDMVDIVIDALRRPHDPRPEGEVVLGEIARQFWARAIETASPTSQRRFLETFIAYLESVVLQAADRDCDAEHTVQTYLAQRRDNIGSYPSYAVLELALDIPDDVFYHPAMNELSLYATEMLIIDNDLVSYNREQASGDTNNILFVIMRQFNCSLDHAMAWAAAYHSQLEARFMDAFKRMPSWGLEIDSQVEEYCQGIANWPRGNDCWSFESGRYFGDKGREVQKTRCVPLLPKKERDTSLRQQDVVITSL